MFAAPVVLLALQGWGLGPTLSTVVEAGEGVERTCLQTGYSTGVGLRLSGPVFHNKPMLLQVTGRGHWLQQASSCVDGFPPFQGTFTEDDRINLLTRPFVTTDVRLAWSFAQNVASLAVGAGNAWHEGHDLPYLVIATGVQGTNHAKVQFGVSAEFQLLRVTSDRFRRTYQNGQLVSEQSLGRVHTVSHALILGAHVHVPF
jgi:hypothetical protein